MIKNIILSLFISFSSAAFAQQEAYNHLAQISNESGAIEKVSWDYMKAVAHGKSARKVDKRRKKLLETLKKAIYETKRSGSYKGDVSLKHAYLEYLNLTFLVLNEDYGKIVDMEAIAEESYDAMEAYILAKEMAGEKLDKAGADLDSVITIFASANNIQIDTQEDKQQRKMRLAGETFHYYNKIYLIFFKSYKQEVYVFDAISRNDLSGIEQNKNTLLTLSMEGIEDVNNYGSFKGDPLLKMTCLNLLNFYKYEAEKGFNDASEFLVVKDRMDKLSAAMETKKPSKRTQEDVDRYNEMIKDYNKVLEKYNRSNEMLNKKRSQLLKNWDDKVEVFMAKHVPK